MHAVGWEWIVIDYVDKVAANLFDNMAKKRFSNVFTKLRVLQMENVDRVLLLDLDLLVRSTEDLSYWYHYSTYSLP